MIEKLIEKILKIKLNKEVSATLKEYNFDNKELNIIYRMKVEAVFDRDICKQLKINHINPSEYGNLKAFNYAMNEYIKLRTE